MKGRVSKKYHILILAPFLFTDIFSITFYLFIQMNIENFRNSTCWIVSQNYNQLGSGNKLVITIRINL